MKKILLLSAILFASTCSVFCGPSEKQIEITEDMIQTCLKKLTSIQKLTTTDGTPIGHRLIEELHSKALDQNHSYATILLPGWIQQTLHQYGLIDKYGNITNQAVRYTILNRWKS